MLLGDNTGYLDMTCNQTVAVDMKGLFNPECLLNMSTVTEPQKLNSHSGMPCKTFGTIEKDVVHSEFNGFLACLSERNVQNVAVSFPMENTNHNMSYEDENKCQFVCDNNSEMIMTEVLDDYVQDLEQFPEQNKAEPLQSNVSFAPMTDSDDMEVAQSQTAVFDDQTDFMELTCQASTGVLSSNLEDPVVTECGNVTTASKPPSLFPEMKMADHFKSELSLLDMVDDIEMTQLHTIGDDPEKACHTVCDDIELTQCQTVVLGTKSCDDYKPSDKSKIGLSLVSTSFRNKGMIHEHTGQMELNRSLFSKGTKSESCVVSTAEKFILQDLSDYMEKQQGTASDMPVIHDDMELRGCKAITIDTKTSWVTGPLNKTKSAPYELSSRPTTYKPKQPESVLEIPVTGLVFQDIHYKSPISVMDLDAGNLVNKHKETISDVAGMNMVRDQTVDTKIYKTSGSDTVNEHMSLSSSVKYVESSMEDSNIEITRAFTVPFEEHCCVALNKEEMAREIVETVPVTSNQRAFKKMDYTVPINNKTLSSGKKGYVVESDIDTLNKEHLSSIKSRRRSLADLQAKLRNISQYISEPDGLLAGSVTAPLVSFTVMSPVDKYSERENSLQSSKETQLLESKMNLANEESTTPFSLKNSLMARLSVGGVMPKLPPRARSASPNETEPNSPNGLQGLQQTCFTADVQNGCSETDLIDEVLLEEDLSGTLVSYLSKNKEQEVTEVDLNEEPIEYDHMESAKNRSYSEKMPPEVKDVTMKDTSKKLVRCAFVLY